jgi:hypothetical protein
VDQIFFQWLTGKAVKASRSSVAALESLQEEFGVPPAYGMGFLL